MEEKYVEFIRTSQKGDYLEEIKGQHPDGIIFVNSEREGNIYIGYDRITDH